MLRVTLISGILVIVLYLKTIRADGLPFPKCYIDDPELNNCLLNGFKSLKPYVGNGIEEIGLPSLKPLVVSKLRISQNAPLATYTCILENGTFTGLDNYDVKEIGYNPITMTFNGRIEYNKIILSGIMDFTGHIITPIEGKGHANVILGPISGIFHISGNLKNEKGINYYNTTTVSVNLDIADARCLLDGFFGDNIYLTRTTNDILNANSKLVVDVLTPTYEKLTEFGIENLMASLTKAIPYNQLFPWMN